MVICRKGTRRSEGAAAGPKGRPSNGHRQGGPVFFPPRKPSPFAQALLAKSVEGSSVTAYDDLWYLGRPRA